MLRVRLLAVAATVLAAAGCTTTGVAGSAQRWHTFTQPPGPMRLTFSYPPGWTASGHTFVSTMGNVGVAEVTGATAATMAQFNAASSCRQRERLLDGSGANISWWANIGSPQPTQLSAMGGRRVRVNGHPARLAQTKSSVCGPETLINGTIQMGSHIFLSMHAEVGAQAKPGTLAAVRKIFFSARQ